MEKIFYIDTRSLALQRICIGVIIIFDLIVRAKDFFAHYTDFGVLPQHALLNQYFEPGMWSLYLINSSPIFQAFLLILTAISALMLIVGFRTPLAAFLTWILIASLHYRNPFVLNSGDILLRMILFWFMFLPLGARCSLDRLFNNSSSRPTKVFNFSSAFFLLQICSVYWFSVMLKNHPIWIGDFTAIEYALSVDQLTTFFGKIFPNRLKSKILMFHIVI